MLTCGAARGSTLWRSVWDKTGGGVAHLHHGVGVLEHPADERVPRLVEGDHAPLARVWLLA